MRSRIDNDGDRTVARRVPESVREQVVQDSLHLLRCTAHGRRLCIPVRLESDPSRASVRLEASYAALDETVQAGLTQLERKHAGVDPRELEQVVDERRQHPQLVADRRQVFVRLRKAVIRGAGQAVVDKHFHFRNRHVVKSPASYIDASINLATGGGGVHGPRKA